MKICIVSPGRSYSPDSLAYQDFFSSEGHECVLRDSSESLEDSDVAILVSGFYPFWRSYPPVVVVEYRSLSTGSFRVLKDLMKRVFNKRGDVYVFLNDYVRRGSFFRASAQHVIRPMGYFQVNRPLPTALREFDVVYAGSVRPGVKSAIEKLAGVGLGVLVLGDFSGPFHANVTVVPSVPVREVSHYLDRARIGLNFIPPRHPYIHQDSTKVLDYVARGLGVISNDYPWVNQFFSSRGGKFLRLEAVDSAESVRNFEFVSPEIVDLSWAQVLESSGLLRGLLRARSGE